MPTAAPLLIDLTGVARLADVRRPVASMWRTRFATSTDPFPGPVKETRGRAEFDAMSVAQWLTRTSHGNNPEVVADVAASAAPNGFDISDATHVATVDALLALRAAAGQSVGDLDGQSLLSRANAIDPADVCLVTEMSAVAPAWAVWADLLADAAYSPLEASRLLERRHSATRSAAGSAGPFVAQAEDLLVGLAEALAVADDMTFVIGGSIAPAIAEALADNRDGDIVAASPVEGRSIRRRLLLAGSPTLETLPDDASPRLHIYRLPEPSGAGTSAMLHALDELTLGMRDHDRAVVVAPARALTDAVARRDAIVRTDVLRSGRVRAIVKLPVGLVSSSPREALGLWVLGRDAGDVRIEDRLTAVADVTDVALSPAARADLIADILAAMGTYLDVRAHAFRFARRVATSSLIAAAGALVTSAHTSREGAHATRDLPALLDEAKAKIGDSALATTPADNRPVRRARVEALIAERHLKVIPGTRVERAEIGTSGLVVVTSDDLHDPICIGEHRVDPLEFAARHPSARLTVAGDVIFRTSPTPRAWVDPDGSKVVAHPARVLRINPTDRGGLIPELTAADIARSPGGPGSWRRWMLRRVSPDQSEPLRAALSALTAERHALVQRIAALDAYSELLADGITSGAVTLTETAAPAAPDVK